MAFFLQLRSRSHRCILPSSLILPFTSSTFADIARPTTPLESPAYAMSSDASQIRVLHGVGIAASGFLTGYITMFSIADRYALMAAPTTETAKLWQRLYNVGKNTSPVLAVASSGLFAYLAYQGELGILFYFGAGN